MVEYGGPHGAATAMKLYDPHSEADRREAESFIDQAVKVGEMKTIEAEAYKKTITVINERTVEKDDAA